MRKITKILFQYDMKNSVLTRFFGKLDEVILKKEDKNFIKINKKILPRKSKKIILIEINHDYSFLVHNHFLLKEKIFSNQKIIGIWTQCVNRERGILNLLKFLIFYFLNFLKKRKWFKLYRSMGVEECIDLNNNFLANFINKKTYFIKKNISISQKKKIHKIKYKNIKVGDLIYDYYLRYYKSGTFDCAKKFEFNRILNYVEHCFDNLNKFYEKNKNNLEYYIPQYAGYIHHGIPVRFFLNKKIKTIGSITSCQYTKKFTIQDPYHVYNTKNVKKNFDKLKDKSQKRKKAKKLLIEKFKGKINSDYSYMRKSFYNNKKILKNKNNDVIIFLPNFVDAPHCYGNLIFNDFQEWLVETLDYLLRKNNLRIGIKIHPNSLYVSKSLTNIFIENYKNKVSWIDSEISNKRIFSNKVLLGISPYGTVLHEMAFHNIVPIAAGNNPYMSFGFVQTPKNRKDYFKLIDRALEKKIKFRKNLKDELEESYYMYFLHDNDYIKNLSRKFDLKKFHQGSGVNDIGVLREFLKKGFIK